MDTHEEKFQEIIQTVVPENEIGFDSPVKIISSNAGEEAALYYSCDRFSGIQSSFYILADTFFTNISKTRNRLTYLNDKGLSATAVWPPCLGGKGGGFLIYVDELIIDSTEAVTLRDSFQLQLDSLDRQLNILQFTAVDSL